MTLRNKMIEASTAAMDSVMEHGHFSTEECAEAALNAIAALLEAEQPAKEG